MSNIEGPLGPIPKGKSVDLVAYRQAHDDVLRLAVTGHFITNRLRSAYERVQEAQAELQRVEAEGQEFNQQYTEAVGRYAEMAAQPRD